MIIKNDSNELLGTISENSVILSDEYIIKKQDVYIGNKDRLYISIEAERSIND